MINEFIVSVAAAIKGFDSDAVVYTEFIPQDYKTPCYYIKTLNHNQQLMIHGRRKLTVFDIAYIPTENTVNINEEINRAMELMTEYLCIVEHNGRKYKATGASCEKTDTEAHYTASYNYNTIYHDDVIKMRELKILQESD